MNKEQRRMIPSQLVIEIKLKGDYNIQRSSKMSPVFTGRKKRKEHIKARYFWMVLSLMGFSQSSMCFLATEGSVGSLKHLAGGIGIGDISQQPVQAGTT